MTEAFDALAARFKRFTGYYAPGKDIPAAEGLIYTEGQEAERRRLWAEFCDKEAERLLAGF